MKISELNATTTKKQQITNLINGKIETNNGDAVVPFRSGCDGAINHFCTASQSLNSSVIQFNNSKKKEYFFIHSARKCKLNRKKKKKNS